MSGLENELESILFVSEDHGTITGSAQGLILVLLSGISLGWLTHNTIWGVRDITGSASGKANTTHCINTLAPGIILLSISMKIVCKSVDCDFINTSYNSSLTLGLNFS